MKESYLKFLYGLKELGFEVAEVEDYIKKIDKTQLLIPIVGEFSAGKSTIINSYFDRSILPVGITPETALATEIR